jgi:hypothetical protein
VNKPSRPSHIFHIRADAGGYRASGVSIPLAQITKTQLLFIHQARLLAEASGELVRSR